MQSKSAENNHCVLWEGEAHWRASLPQYLSSLEGYRPLAHQRALPSKEFRQRALPSIFSTGQQLCQILSAFLPLKSPNKD